MVRRCLPVYRHTDWYRGHFLGRVQRTNALGSLGSYTRPVVPVVHRPDRRLPRFVRTDATNRVIEGSMEDNNDRATEQTTLVNLSPVPDLTVLCPDPRASLQRS